MMRLSKGAICLLLFLSPFISFSQEMVSQYYFFGFSDDGRFAAFEIYEDNPVDDGMCSSWIYFLDVDKNDFVSPTLKSGGQLDSIRKANFRRAKPLLTKFNISGKVFGKKVGESFIIGTDTYRVDLKEIPTGETFETGQEEMMFKLSLNHKGQSQILQQDTKIPKSRGRVYTYSIKEVYIKDNKIVVFIECLSPGFEGSPDRRQMVVSGAVR